MEILDKNEKVILEYFWNPYLKKTKRLVSKTIIVHLENDKFSNLATQLLNRTQIDRNLISLERKGYIRSSSVHPGEVYELDNHGAVYFDRKYGTFKKKLQSFIDSTPEIITIVITLFGFLSSVFTLYMGFKEFIKI